jgi:hypothetical protein
MFKTTKRNRETLQEEGALNRNHEPSISATVKDAILLAAAIGIPFLWVDSLCIVQDDEYSRNIHLSSMAVIYANASVTMIAAAGEDADYGIPGVLGGSRTRDKPCRIIQTNSDLRWVVGPMDPGWPYRSKWDTRGWQVDILYLSLRYTLIWYEHFRTFQESLLSTKLLVLDEYASWHCSCCRVQENMESNEEDACPTLRIGIGPTSKQKLKEFATAEPYTAWGFVVERYNTRRLTYDQDVLPAIAGISSVMEAFLEDTFFYGLSMKSLWVGLLWNSQQGLRRRKATIPGAGGAHIDSLPS